MPRERFVVIRPHPALHGDCEREHPHFGPSRAVSSSVPRSRRAAVIDPAIRACLSSPHEGMLVRLLSTDMPASSTITQELLGWKPTHPGLTEDIEQGHYFT
jgi:hypothetical protein